MEEKIPQVVPVEFIKHRSINRTEQETVNTVEVTLSWIDPIYNYPTSSEVSSDRLKARRLRFKAARFATVAVDYFTEWAKAEPVIKITEQKVVDFVWKNIVFRFGIPRTIVSDNSRQFDNDKFRGMCRGLGISNAYSSPRHLQSNGQVEMVNKVIKHHLKTKLEKAKGNWAEEFPFVL
ncbi:uncharacterized protein LOC131233721 [Magnolia sinica]|uniref:uncharacterized protein LOC131233721 n=1 Tax=Magnolia sinica TaxID=86752 RepID=UPI00265A66C0|nr:uncharacterized protein LOC131233721 [Magnolia sinica]